MEMGQQQMEMRARLRVFGGQLPAQVAEPGSGVDDNDLTAGSRERSAGRVTAVLDFILARHGAGPARPPEIKFHDLLPSFASKPQRR